MWSGLMISTVSSCRMSAAVTTPRLVPVDPDRLAAGREWFLTTRLLMFRTRSVTSSTTPGMVRDLVLHALDLDLGDRAALQAGQEDAPQAVADRDAEAAFERLDVELAVGVGQRLAVADDPAGQFQATPTDAHGDGLQSEQSSVGQRSSTVVEPGLRTRRLADGWPRVSESRTSMISCSANLDDQLRRDRQRDVLRPGRRVTRPSGGSVPVTARGSRGPAACPSAAGQLAASLLRVLAVLDLRSCRRA